MALFSLSLFLCLLFVQSKRFLGLLLVLRLPPKVDLHSIHFPYPRDSILTKLG